MEESRRDTVVCIDYSDLGCATEEKQEGVEYDECMSKVLDKIGQAFGSDDSCLGILAVTNVPGELERKRNALLPIARDLAKLPAKDLDEVIVPEAGYQVGWSHGKEKLEGDNNFDMGKGSFYANPLTDDFVSAVKERLLQKEGNTNDLASSKEIDEAVQKNPEFFATNEWPSKLPHLKSALIDVANIVHSVGVMLAKLCDMYVKSKSPSASFTKLEDVLTHSLYCKARLLHYFPTKTRSLQNNGSLQSNFSDWCGWHNDHGSLTGLIPGMYLDDNGEQIECPDKKAGLYIKSRGGDTIQVELPSQHNCLAYQIGETTQIHTGGILQATPHAVKGCESEKAKDISRESFAVFMEPEYHGNMNLIDGKTIQDAQNEEKAKLFLPRGVRTLKSRFKPGMNFGEFSEATFQAFY